LSVKIANSLIFKVILFLEEKLYFFLNQGLIKNLIVEFNRFFSLSHAYTTMGCRQIGSIMARHFITEATRLEIPAKARNSS